MAQFIKIRRALLSVSDKTGIVSLAKTLRSHGCEIISTGGTRKILEANDIEVTEISTVTHNPEAFDGRMKTISFKIESALLFDREKHAKEADLLGIEPIDLVVCNLYPFGKAAARDEHLDILVDYIDIGGPTMIRAAAKNFKYVTTLVDPTDYQEFMEDLDGTNGCTVYEQRQVLMAKAFNHTADYDALIATTMDAELGICSRRLTFEEGISLRYGENSHQEAQFYRQKGATNALYDQKRLHGKKLSFNNILDVHAALEAIRETQSKHYACSVVKHNNPCGLAEGDADETSQRDVLELAWAGDPVSAFGSIVAFNFEVIMPTVEFFELENKAKRKFIECVVAPCFSTDALEYLKQSKNLRIIQYDVAKMQPEVDYRFMNGSLLEQTIDDKTHDKMETVTKCKVDSPLEERALIEFGLRAIKTVKSNSILIVRKKDDCFQLLGMGAGQPNRLIATKIALEKAQANDPEYDLGEAWMISDAFYPFPDCVEYAAQYGIRKVVQPGGSIKDKQVIEACNRMGVCMVLTGLRHFKH